MFALREARLRRTMLKKRLREGKEGSAGGETVL